MSAVALLQAVTVMADLAQTAARLMEHAQAVSEVITRAQAEGRSELTAEEWGDITRRDFAARIALQQALTERADAQRRTPAPLPAAGSPPTG